MLTLRYRRIRPLDLPRHYLKVVKLILLLALVSLFLQPAIYTPIHYTVQSYWEQLLEPQKIPDEILRIVTPENASRILDEEIDGFRALDYAPIPKILHQIYADDQVPEVYAPLIASWLKHHPDHEYWLWDDISGRMLIEKHYPKFLPLWDAYCHPLFRSDALRYFVLHRYGGIYMDMDYIAYKNLRPLFADRQCLVVEENRAQSRLLYRVPGMIMNAFLASVPRHPYMHFLINSLPSTASCYFHDVLKSTGPVFIFQARKKYTEVTRCNILEGCYVHVLSSDVMMPSWDLDAVRYARKVCGKSSKLSALQMEACKTFISFNFTASPPISKEVYANHLFLHLGNFGNKFNSVNRVGIRTIVPHAITPSDGKI